MRALALVALLVCSAPSTVSAQGVSVRLGVGPAYGAGTGAAGFAALQLDGDALLARVEARGTATGRSADWEHSARVLGLGAAGGLLLGRAPAALRPYVMATAAEGIDPREADRVTSVGALVGAALGARRRFFGELRYERWWQHGVTHHRLPSYMLSAAIGLALP